MRALRYLLLLVGIAGLCTTKNIAQPRPFLHFGTDEGLSQNSVHCFYQDSQGLLWIGTQYGLNRFNGRDFRVYRHDAADSNTLSDQFILSISEDAAGNLWVGTGNGLNRLNRRTGKCERIYLTPGENNRISSHYPALTRNRSGEIFVKHARRPVKINHAGKIEDLDTSFGRLLHPVFDSRDRLWGFDKNNRLYAAAGMAAGSLRQQPGPPGLEATKVRYRCSTNEEWLWCWPESAPGKIYRLNLQTLQWDPACFTLPAAINQLTAVPGGRAWVSTLEGICEVKPGYPPEWIRTGMPGDQSLAAGSMLCSFADRHGNLWAGSATNGFYLFQPGFRNFNLLPTSPSAAVTSVLLLSGEERWLGTSGGLLMYRKTSTEGGEKVIRHLFGQQRITGLAADRQGHIWAAVEKKGLNILDRHGNVIRSYHQQDSLLQTQGILSLYCDSKGRIIVCTERGFYVFSSTAQWQSFYQGPEKPTSTGWYTLSVFEDRNQHLWFCKHLGIEKRNTRLERTGEIPSGSSTTPVNRSIITGCTEDQAGRIWISTLSAGIYVYRDSIIRHYTRQEGLAANAVYGIITDSTGRIWATTAAGICILENEQTGFYTLGRSEGLPVSDFVIGALYKMPGNVLLAGSTRGLVTIYANGVSSSPRTAIAQLSDVSINGQSLPELNDPIRIPPGFKTLAFEFTLNEPLQPQHVFYQYRLMGVDSNWYPLPAEFPRITYSNLPYKNLRLEVRAAYTAAGLPRAKVAAYFISVTAPWWATTWFRGLMLTLVAAICWTAVYLYGKFKYRRQRRAQQLQEKLREERERISRDLHDNIGAYTSALIAGISQLKDAGNLQSDQLDEMQEYATGMMGYLRETIWVLNNPQLRLSAFADRFKRYAARMIRQYPGTALRFREEMLTERELSPELSLQLFRMLQEAFQNACKHAGASCIEVGFQSNGSITVYVKDDGKGMQSGIPGDAHGLRNMKERAGQSGWTFSIESVPDGGTQITFRENNANAG